jgi:hypothetical protein
MHRKINNMKLNAISKTERIKIQDSYEIENRAGS